MTAVFLKVAEKGEEGKVGKEGPSGNEGKAGATGPAGEKGATGAQGPAGPTGTRGPAGPAGKVEVVTCTEGQEAALHDQDGVGHGQFHDQFGAQATLSRHGAVYAIGRPASVRGRLSLRLTPLRSLRPGKYTLTLISGSGRHETIRSEAFTLG